MPEPQEQQGLPQPQPPVRSAADEYYEKYMAKRATEQAKAALPKMEENTESPAEATIPGASKISAAYAAAKNWLAEHEQHLSEKVLAPFRQGLDNMAADLQAAGESGHTKSGGQLTGPARALASGVGTALKYVPVGKDVSETVQLAATPKLPEGHLFEGLRVRPAAAEKLYQEALEALGPETKAAAAKTAVNASGESAASQEAINRAASEKVKGETYHRIDSRSGREIRLSSIDGVDAKPGPWEHIIKRSPSGENILDSGAKARPYSLSKKVN